MPIASLQGVAKVAVYCSPISYLVAGFDLSLLVITAVPIGLTWAALSASALFSWRWQACSTGEIS